MSGLFTRIGAEVHEVSRQDIANRIAADFEAFLNAWHASNEVYDNPLDAQIHEWYAQALRGKQLFPPRDAPYFSPSSANSDPRELYEKMRGAKKDVSGRPPYQGRWVRIGTAIGDVIQRDILFAEKHYAKAIGQAPRFKFERTADGRPMFEDFAKVAAPITHNKRRFYLYGTCDGIMTYRSDDGELIRVGLEVKSKQTTFSQTSEYSQRSGPKEDHVKQCVCYSLMYGNAAEPIDYYVILYVNASKKSWQMSDEDFAKSPDIKAHGIAITDGMRTELLDHLAGIVASAEIGNPPALDIGKWTFNNFKSTCAKALTDEEMAVLERQVDAMNRSGLPDFKKRQFAEAFEDITRLRTEVTAV
ncbi:hypothetical protein G9U52_15090 [Paenibacillus sp. S3N08]|uniref:YqaJ viral recombinase domain-containing protein n=2 Tax=Paenibacillus agricola TaxID=2716264 RepID=A0ABX0J5C2_9BACL|nr:hypothetical protein [Paenibacillus agricola]